MKAKALQFGKAMSAALFVLLLVVVGSKNALAQTQVATLQHGDDVSVYYGTNAFVEAHTAAETGDIITLSSGTFVPTTITKAITLRGAGCAIDTVANTYPTIFGGEMMLYVPDTIEHLTIEGILFTLRVYPKELHNARFNRCNFADFDRNTNGMSWNMYNSQFVNCIIDQFNFYSAKNTVLINSVVWDPSSLSNDHTVVLYNSIMRIRSYNSCLSAYNSIILNDGYGSGSSCSFISCIGIYTGSGSGSQSNVFGSGYATNCVLYNACELVFESYNYNMPFSFDVQFNLKDEIASSILGNDGTQVGIYGGMIPYSNRPTYMVLKRCNVANKSTIDGKLSVDIEVVTEEE